MVRLATMSMWTTATGEHYRSKAALVQGLWVGGLLFVGGMLMRGRYDYWRSGASLALLGLTAYLLMFEVRPRYLLALVPVVLATVLTSRGEDTMRHPIECDRGRGHAGPVHRLPGRLFRA